jgi:hypothetical protein
MIFGVKMLSMCTEDNGIETDGQKDRQTDRTIHTDRETNTHTHTHTDRQTNTHTHTHTHKVGGDLLVMTPPAKEARKPTLTRTRVMRRPLLWRCSMTNMSRPIAPWTKSEEKRHHRNTQYHISEKRVGKNTSSRVVIHRETTRIE